MNQRLRRNLTPSVVRDLVLAVATLLLMVPTAALAQFTGSALGSVQYEHNSNIFALDSGVGQPVVDNRSGGDSTVAYAGAFDVKYVLGRQQFYAAASLTKIDYQRFSELDHTDNNINAGMKWVLGSLFDGKFDVTHSHAMVQFYDLRGTELSVNTTQQELAQAGVKLPSNWKLEGSLSETTVKEPLPAQPDLQSKGTAGVLTLKYMGISRISMGVYTGYESGEFEGTIGPGNASYRQTTAGVVGNYLSGRSTFDGQLGYTRRTSANGTNDTSGFTGEIGITDQITPKTSVQLRLSRALNSYVTNASAEVDTAAEFRINWQATYKLTAGVGYTFTYRQYPGQGNDPIGADRTDAQQYATLNINYQPRPWLQIRPYANVQTRVSNYIGANFNQTIFGVTLTVRTPTKPKTR